jgi:hypothetical protein
VRRGQMRAIKVSYEYGEAMVMAAPGVYDYPTESLLRLTAATGGCWCPTDREKRYG